jgi:G3E family GTPase
VGGPGPLLLNGVQHVVHPPVHLGRWPDGDRRSRIVFIARGLDPGAVEASLAAFNAAARA